MAVVESSRAAQHRYVYDDARPTEGSVVYIVANDRTRTLCPNLIGTQGRIIRDDRSAMPYCLEGCDHWFRREDVKAEQARKYTQDDHIYLTLSLTNDYVTVTNMAGSEVAKLEREKCSTVGDVRRMAIPRYPLAAVDLIQNDGRQLTHDGESLELPTAPNTETESSWRQQPIEAC